MTISINTANTSLHSPTLTSGHPVLALDWWSLDRNGETWLYARHCDMNGRRHPLIVWESGRHSPLVSPQHGDIAERAACQRTIDALIANGHLTFEMADRLAKSSNTIRDVAKNSGAASKWYRDSAKHVDQWLKDANGFNFTDRDMVTGITSPRSRVICARQNMGMIIPNFAASKCDSWVDCERGAGSPPCAPEPLKPATDVVSDTTDDDTTDEVVAIAGEAIKSDSAEYSKMLQAAQLVGVDLPKFIKTHAPASAPITIDPRAEQADGSLIPVASGTFKWRGSGWEAAKSALTMAHAAGDKQVVLATGPTGCGKTMGAVEYAAQSKRPCIIVDCTTLTEPTDLFGSLVAVNGSTKFVTSKVVDVLAMDGAVVIFDEVNRASAAVRNAMFAILDGRGATTIESVLDEDQNPIEVHVAGNAAVICTANIGAEYAGVARLDMAFRNRATCEVRVSYLTPASERDLLVKLTGVKIDAAQKIATLAAWFRAESQKAIGGQVTTSMSTRRSIETAKHVARGMDLLEAMTIGSINSVDDDTERTACMAFATQCVSG
tara:strand:- start:1562 stop:3208 length:1647 start_codon:yes stop_codon:yes gene_type:complete